MLTVLGDDTRETLCVAAAAKMGSADVLEAHYPLLLRSGCPWENSYNERYNGTLRHEVLNAEWLAMTRQAQIVINQWLRQSNHIRPHHALGMRPPVSETIRETPQISGPVQGG